MLTVQDRVYRVPGPLGFTWAQCHFSPLSYQDSARVLGVIRPLAVEPPWPCARQLAASVDTVEGATTSLQSIERWHRRPGTPTADGALLEGAAARLLAPPRGSAAAAACHLRYLQRKKG